MPENVSRILDRAAALDGMRDTHMGVWEDLARVCFPRLHSVFRSANQPLAAPHESRARVAENHDGTAMRALRVLATGQASRITPMGGRWFQLRPPATLKDDQQASNWYAACTERLATMLQASNFYNRAYECYEFRGCFGVSALEVLPGRAGRGLHFRSLPVGSFSVAENEHDEIDTIFRTHFRTPAQILEQFPDSAPAEVRKLAEEPATRDKPTEKVLHAIYPRTDRDPRRADPASKPIASLHIHVASHTLLLESGFDSVPVAVSRWSTSPISPYGWGPADYALPEASQANHMEQMQDTLAELAAFPRILYPAGMKDDIDFAAMGLTSFDPAAGEHAVPREWLTAGRYDVWKDRAADKKRAIEDAFFVELFTAVSRLSPDATATQVSAIVSESRELFHPIYSNMVREFLTPVLRRSFTLAMLQGQMPDPPPSVIEADDLGAFIADPEVEYISAMALALEASQITDFSDVANVLLPLAQHDPAFLDALSPESITGHLVRLKGLPVSFLRTPEELEALHQQRQAAAAAQQAAQASQAVRNMGGLEPTREALSQLTPDSEAAAMQ